MQTVGCVDLGGTNLKAGLVRGNSVAHLTEAPVQTGDVLQQTIQCIQTLQSRMAVEMVGISVRGIIDPHAGVVREIHGSLSELIGVAVADVLQDALGVPVCLDNDARMYTTGEWLNGAGRSVDDLVVLTLGTGIGA